MQKRAAIYVRVSTDKQTVENQVAALRQIAHPGSIAPRQGHAQGRA
jgi:DNA invertase Pin-like site-specific DNA recombinase